MRQDQFLDVTTLRDAGRLWRDALDMTPRAPESELTQFHKDVARSLQVVLEEVLLRRVEQLHERVPETDLCMAGGVALNCVANGRILRDGPFKRLFVQPAASDAGSDAARSRTRGEREPASP